MCHFDEVPGNSDPLTAILKMRVISDKIEKTTAGYTGKHHLGEG